MADIANLKSNFIQLQKDAINITEYRKDYQALLHIVDDDANELFNTIDGEIEKLGKVKELLEKINTDRLLLPRTITLERGVGSVPASASASASASALRPPAPTPQPTPPSSPQLTRLPPPPSLQLPSLPSVSPPPPPAPVPALPTAPVNSDTANKPQVFNIPIPSHHSLQAPPLSSSKPLSLNLPPLPPAAPPAAQLNPEPQVFDIPVDDLTSPTQLAAQLNPGPQVFDIPVEDLTSPTQLAAPLNPGPQVFDIPSSYSSQHMLHLPDLPPSSSSPRNSADSFSRRIAETRKRLSALNMSHPNTPSPSPRGSTNSLPRSSSASRLSGGGGRHKSNKLTRKRNHRKIHKIAHTIKVTKNPTTNTKKTRRNSQVNHNVQ